MTKKLNQHDRVFQYLVENKTITQLQAYQEFGTFSLAKIISNLRKKGFNIETIKQQGLNRFGDKVHFAEYRLHINLLAENKGA